MKIDSQVTFTMSFDQFQAMKNKAKESVNGQAAFDKLLPSIIITDAPWYYIAWQWLKKLVKKSVK